MKHPDGVRDGLPSGPRLTVLEMMPVCFDDADAYFRDRAGLAFGGKRLYMWHGPFILSGLVPRFLGVETSFRCSRPGPHRRGYSFWVGVDGRSAEHFAHLPILHREQVGLGLGPTWRRKTQVLACAASSGTTPTERDRRSE